MFRFYSRSIVLIMMVLSFYQSSSQGIQELGVRFGQAYYIGELNQSNHFNFNNYNNTYGILYRFNINSRWAWRNTLSYFTLNGDDAISNYASQVTRNLSFKSEVYEFTSGIEFNFFRLNPFNENDRITPFLFWSLGGFYHNPTAELNGNEYELRALMTEGQNEPYSNLVIEIPMGAGVKIKLFRWLYLNADWTYRRTATDYIDDISGTYPDPSTISKLSASLSNKSLNKSEAPNNNWFSQRGNSQNKDKIGSFEVTLTFKIGKNPNLCYFNPLK